MNSPINYGDEPAQRRQDCRSMSCTPSTRCSTTGRSPFAAAFTRISMPASPISYFGRWTVVRGGSMIAETSRLSKPTMELGVWSENSNFSSRRQSLR